MAIRKPGLGKGLEALLGHYEDELQSSHQINTLPIDVIERCSEQPRRDFDPEALATLAHSISTQGLIQPILVRPIKNTNRYQIIAGERRWRAAQKAGLDKIPVVVKEVNDQDAMCIALIENIQRQDLNAIEEALALQRLLREFGMTHQSIADQVGRSRPTVSNLLRLLELNAEVKTMLSQNQIEMGHARTLLALNSFDQLKIAQKIVAEKLSVRQTEMLIKKLKKGTTKKRKQDDNIAHLENQLSEQLSTTVQIKAKKNGSGSLLIQYHSLKKLDDILKRISEQ